MKIKLPKFKNLLKRYTDFIFLITSALIVIFLMQSYNFVKSEQRKHLFSILNNIYFEKTLQSIVKNLDPKYITISHKVSSGESFNNILTNYEIPNSEIKKIKKILSKHQNLNKLKKNQVINFTIDVDNSREITNFIYPISKLKKIRVFKDLKEDNFQYEEIITNLNKKLIYREGTILSSLYKSAVDLKIKPNIIIEFARIYGFQIDFQRDLRKNDTFQILYEIFEDDKKKVYETGEIIFANMIIKGQNNKLYYFDKENFEGHYDENGKSAKKALMKTPINGARLSSSFGMRKHPILGYNKMHRGIDFAAPIGTPVYAGGNGVIEYLGNNGSYGKYIRIRHLNGYKTAYAHLSGYKKGLSKGSRVNQGEIIAYVGSTGRSTGPHLHYEIIYNNEQINPLKLKLPSGKVLKGKELERFNKSYKTIYANHLNLLFE